MNRRVSELLNEIYEYAEALKLLTWYAIERDQDGLELEGKLEPDERRVDAEATFDGKILKIIVNDVLPRKADMKAVKSLSWLREYWAGNIIRAIKRLKTPIRFDRALCRIRVYVPRNIEWDVDNRAVNIIVNALRMIQVVSNDSWDKVSLLIEGGVDREKPRTEVTVVEYPENVIKELFCDNTGIPKTGNTSLQQHTMHI